MSGLAIFWSRKESHDSKKLSRLASGNLLNPEMEQPNLDCEVGEPTSIVKTNERFQRDEVPKVRQALAEAEG